MTRGFLAVAAAGLLVTLPAALSAQPATGAARLSVSVIDQTGAVIPGATVTVVGLDNATKAAAAPTVKTNDKGVAAFDALVPGRYSITAEFPGFELGLVADVRFRSGDNRHLVVLPIKKVEEAVTVGADAVAAASTRTGS